MIGPSLSRRVQFAYTVGIAALVAASAAHAQTSPPNTPSTNTPSTNTPSTGTPPSRTTQSSESGANLGPPRGGPPPSADRSPDAPAQNSEPATQDTPSTATPPKDSAIPPPPEGTTPAPYRIPQPPSANQYPSGQRGYTARAGITTDDGTPIPSRIVTRLRVLDTDLQVLAGRGSNRIVDGVLSIVTGGLSIGIGVWVDDKPLRAYLWLWGGANITRGILDLALTPNASTPSIKYSHMPMQTLPQVQHRLAYGESSLEHIAKRTRLTRVLNASINIAVGLSVIPLFLGPNNFEVDDPFDYFVLIGSGISVISGIINLATRSDAERRWSAYQDLRDRLVKDEGSSDKGSGDKGSNDENVNDEKKARKPKPVRARLAPAITPQGGGLVLAGQF